MGKKAVAGVQISGVSDDLFYSLKGNPVGIRISFDAAFPSDGYLSVSPAIRAVDKRLHNYMTSMSHFAKITIEPKPERAFESLPGGRAGQAIFFCQ